jgi:hypothetical protein
MSSTRNIQDALFIQSKALPAAGATAVTVGIDLGTTTIGAAAESVEYLIELPILPALVDDKTVILSLEDSATLGGSYLAIAGTGTLTTVGTETPGNAAAVLLRGKLPTITRQFVRLTTTVLAAGGDNTGVDATLSLKF